MVVNEHGEQRGSLSGGCIEEELIATLCAKTITRPTTILYGATAEEAERLQLPCGGTVRVLIEPINAAYQEHLQHIIAALRQHQRITRHIDFAAGVYRLQADEKAPFALQRDNNTPLTLTHTLGPVAQLFIIGASDVSQAVAELAQWMDYEVIVCDPRAEKLQQWPLPGCVLLNMLPDEGLQAYADNPELAIVALTHDPRIDDMGLLKAFECRAHYIGAMGSQKTSQKRRERLLQLGITEQQLQLLRAPVGLDIGSKTPREIALAILAELTLHSALTRE